MRYFFIAYTFMTESREGKGNIWFELNGFPSNEEVKGLIMNKKTPYNLAKYHSVEIAVTNIFEFKSKEDFEAWRLTTT